MLRLELVVVDAVDDGQVGIGGRRRNQHLLRAGSQMRGRLVAVSENAGAFQRDVDLQFLPRQLGRIALGGHLDRSEEHTSELQSLMRISYAVFCLKKKTTT